MRILPKLTKDYILERVSQEEIFTAYSDASLADIHDCVQTNSLIHSPIRKDNDPTFGFYYKNGKLKGQDFAGYFWGDCFDVVAYRLNLDANNSQNFAAILQHIARTFKIHEFAKSDFKLEKQELTSFKNKTQAIVEYDLRVWLKQDAEFWKYHNRASLEKDCIYPVKELWVNSQHIYTFKPEDPAYIYLLGGGKVKVYFPFRTVYRFISNAPTVQGLLNFEPCKYAIITKSFKDVKYLRLFKEKFDLDAIAPASEKTLITKRQYDYIKVRSDFQFTLFDYDNTGIHKAFEYRKVYGIEPLFLKDKVWGRKLGYRGCKDFYDVVMNYGLDTAEDLITQTIQFYEQQRRTYENNIRVRISDLSD